jgi:hypothetical protein
MTDPTPLEDLLTELVKCAREVRLSLYSHDGLRLLADAPHLVEALNRLLNIIAVLQLAQGTPMMAGTGPING